MYGRGFTRIAIIIAFGFAAAFSPPFGGYPFILDGWLWHSLRDAIRYPPWRLPLAVSAAMIIADFAGMWVPPMRVRVRRPACWAISIALGAAVALWMFRVKFWLGDYHGIDVDPLPWWKLEAAEPLGALTSYYALHWGTVLGWPPSTIVAFVVTAFGASAVAAVFLWSRLISAEWPLVFGMFLCSGFMVLFFGYPEKGTPKSVSLVCWYVYFATRALRERSLFPGIAASLSLSLAGLMHGSALCFVPAHFYCVWRHRERRHARLEALAFFAPFAAMAWYAHTGAPFAGGKWGNVAAPWQWIKAYCITNCEYDFFSVAHLADIVNCLLILGPVALLCLPEALSRTHDQCGRWLAVGALGWMFLSVIWFPVFGYISDWDIFAGTPLVISYLAIYVGVQVMPPADFRRLALAWMAGSAIHAAAWWKMFQTPF